MRLRLTVVAIAVLVGVAGCGSADIADESLPNSTASPSSVPVATSTGSVSPTIPAETLAPETVPSETVPPATAPPTTLPPTTLPPTSLPPEPVYVGAVREIDAETAASMTPTSIRDGCPVGIDELRLVEVTYVNYDDAEMAGRVVVHRDHAEGIAQVFEELFAARFPMQSVDLVDVHGGSDQASMQANNTSAFNCREVAYSPGVWSNHATGTAIDINPLVNPYVRGDFVDPEAGRPFADRNSGAQGLIVAGDVVVTAFERIGWTWGGYWNNSKDSQHFSASGS